VPGHRDSTSRASKSIRRDRYVRRRLNIRSSAWSLSVHSAPTSAIHGIALVRSFESAQSGNCLGREGSQPEGVAGKASSGGRRAAGVAPQYVLAKSDRVHHQDITDELRCCRRCPTCGLSCLVESPSGRLGRLTPARGMRSKGGSGPFPRSAPCLLGRTARALHGNRGLPRRWCTC
jgi:hypothetical protein